MNDCLQGRQRDEIPTPFGSELFYWRDWHEVGVQDI